MSKFLIEEQIRKFLISETPEVMAIKGEWGVGKTYSWNSFLKKAREDKIIKLTSYSYVSLFGINNLDTLKYSLFENSIPVDLIGTEPNLATLKENTTGVLQGYGKIAGGIFKNIPFAKNFTPILESLAFISLNKTIICIDDLERKGLGLSLKDVLGLVSLLKEHKKCKVILLLNDGTKETEEFNTYKEKVLDIELLYRPSPEESAAIAYEGGKIFHQKLSEYTQKLSIRNIRILKKIERSIDIVSPYFVGVSPSVFEDAMSSIVLFSFCFYSSTNNEAPALSFISSGEFYLYGFINQKEDNDPQKLAWKKVISDYGYMSTDSVDEELLNLVKHGYVTDGVFKKVIEEKNQAVMRGASIDAFSEAWQLFHDSFENNEADVLDGLIISFKQNYKAVSPGSLDALVEFLKKFNRHAEAKDLISFYIENRSSEKELFDVNSRELVRSLKDGDVIDAFNDAYYSTEEEKKETLLELLVRLHNQRGWGNKDIKQLTQASIQEYYDAFKGSAGSGSYSVVESALQFSHLRGNNIDYDTITWKVKWALTMISYESLINKMRVERFNVDLENL